MRVVYVYMLLIFTAFGQVAFSQANPAPRSLPFPEVRLGPNGEGAEGVVWLSWSADKRAGFAGGFIQGYANGWRSACSWAAELSGVPSDLYLKCTNDRGDILGQAESYSATATEYYTEYPEDRALPLNRLFLQLLKSGMTAQQIHEWLDKLIEASKDHR